MKKQGLTSYPNLQRSNAQFRAPLCLFSIYILTWARCVMRDHECENNRFFLLSFFWHWCRVQVQYVRPTISLPFLCVRACVFVQELLRRNHKPAHKAVPKLDGTGQLTSGVVVSWPSQVVIKHLFWNPFMLPTGLKRRRVFRVLFSR